MCRPQQPITASPQLILKNRADASPTELDRFAEKTSAHLSASAQGKLQSKPNVRLQEAQSTSNIQTLQKIRHSIVALSLSQAAGAIPIRERYDGFVFNSSTSFSPVLLEAFFNPLCSDSADAWPVVKKIAQHYQDDLLLIVHPFPLAYHQGH
ncbi:hypothetical protein L7F22_028568 [Adiantum nelumboides]|nr:hypothetical protein [Adiantum nelumboides]